MKKIIALLLVIFSFVSILEANAAVSRNRRVITPYTANNSSYYYQNSYQTNVSNYPYYNNYTYTNTQYSRPNTTQPQVIYVYQTVPATPISVYSSYPGCSRSDIIIGGQIWASCNAVDRNIGSVSRSGWFFANDLQSSFVSYNGQGQRLEWQGKVTPQANWGDGPCAPGYRLPTRGEWETVRMYARQNNTSVSYLLDLPQNGAYRGYKDSNSDVRIEYRYDVAGAYWSSTVEYNGGYFPMVMHLGAPYGGYRLDGTNYALSYPNNQWQYTDTGLELVTGNSSELANVRCIKK